MLMLLLVGAATAYLREQQGNVYGCNEFMIGDGHCDLHCLLNFDDGGDCSRDDYCKIFKKDGWCDPICYDEKYNWDGGDCKVCIQGWHGNGYCDIGCNDASHDGGDCVCEKQMIADEHCDAACMSEAFEWDGARCCVQHPRSAFALLFLPQSWRREEEREGRCFAAHSDCYRFTAI